MFSFLKNHHYIWDTGLSGHLSWAPQGTKLKRRVEDYLRREFALCDFEEIETSLIYRREVWERSGHWDRFQDPIVRTTQGRCLRVDKLLEEHYPGLDYSSLSETYVLGLLKDLNEQRKSEYLKTVEQALNKDMDPGKPDLLLIGSKLDYQSLMMQCLSGSQEAGLRPETATTTYFHYADLSEAMGHKMPLKVFQIGKSFRNEISPKHSLIRGREFTQAEFQMILPVEMKANEDFASKELSGGLPPGGLLDRRISLYQPGSPESLQRVQIRSIAPGNPVLQSLIAITYGLFERLGFSLNKLRLRRHGPDEMAFYALDAYDIEIDLKELGWTEIAGIHDRGEWDLRHISENKQDSTNSVPHILEVAIGVDRLVYAILDRLYEEKSVDEGKTTLKLPYFLAPIQVSVLPLLKNRPLIVAKAREVYRMLKASHFTAEYADKKSIGKRYLENARRGIPWSITIDYDTLQDDTVTVRDRNTEAQVRISIKDLRSHLLERLYKDIDGTETPIAETKSDAEAVKEKDYVSISRCDFRVGRIVRVEKHLNADSLYIEQIDLGEDSGPRTIVSGLVKHVPMDEMQDRLVVVFANLKPSNLKSVKSYGMVMCASSEDHSKVEILDPPAGSTVGDRIIVTGEEGDADKVIDMKKRSCPWPDIQAHLSVDSEGRACFRGTPLTVALTVPPTVPLTTPLTTPLTVSCSSSDVGPVVTCKTLRNVSIS